MERLTELNYEQMMLIGWNVVGIGEKQADILENGVNALATYEIMEQTGNMINLSEPYPQIGQSYFMIQDTKVVECICRNLHDIALFQRDKKSKFISPIVAATELKVQQEITSHVCPYCNNEIKEVMWRDIILVNGQYYADECIVPLLPTRERLEAGGIIYNLEVFSRYIDNKYGVEGIESLMLDGIDIPSNIIKNVLPYGEEKCGGHCLTCNSIY